MGKLINFIYPHAFARGRWKCRKIHTFVWVVYSKKCISQYDLYGQPDIWPEVLVTLSGFFIGQTRVPASPVAVIGWL
jgi:hypothetical protein